MAEATALKKVKRILIPAIIFIIGIVISVNGVNKIHDVVKYPQVQARVTAVNRSAAYDSDNSEYITVYVEYELSGQLFNEVLNEAPPYLAEADIVTVRYNPDKPDYVIAASSTAGIVITVIGLIAVAFAICLLVIPLLKGKKK